MRIPVSMQCLRESQSQDPESCSREPGDLVIDESEGHPETPQKNNLNQITGRGHNEITPSSSPYHENEGLRSSSTSINSVSYEQLGHVIAKPSSSTLSLLASSKKLQSISRYHHHPYLRKSEEKDEYLMYGNSSVAHSTGIWTPCSTTTANFPTPSTSSLSQTFDGYQHSGQANNEQAVPHSGSYLFEMNIPSSSSNNGSSNNGGCLQYKVENSPSPHRNYENGNSSEAGGDGPVPVEVSIKNAFFTQDKVDTLCDVMLRSKNLGMLEQYLSDLPKDIHDSENVLRAKAALAYENGNYTLLYNILESRMFSSRFHKELQELYQNARYMEAGKIRGRMLGAVDKYRIRRKYQLPQTIWDGESTSYTFKDRDRKLLVDAYRTNNYPNSEMKKDLQLLTGLDKKQIDNWFKNRRQRDRPLDAKSRKSTAGHQDGLVATPASSIGSNGSDSLMYVNATYHSPDEEESMDIKYATYNNVSPSDTKPFTTSMTSDNELPAPCKPKLSKRKPTSTNNNSAKTSGVAWAKGTVNIMDGGLRRRKRSKFLNADCDENESFKYSGMDYDMCGGLNSSKIKQGNQPSTIVHHNNLAGTSSVACDATSSNASSLERNMQGFHNSLQNVPQYSGSCSSIVLNHHHHQAGLAGMGVAWSNWHASTSGSGTSVPESPYSSMAMLPSLAASFGHHHSHHHHHHPINMLNSESRIPVQ